MTSRGILKAIIIILMIPWLLVVVPVWVLSMGFSGSFGLLPDLPLGVEFWSFVAAQFLPPIISAVLGYVLVKRSGQDEHASN